MPEAIFDYSNSSEKRCVVASRIDSSDDDDGPTSSDDTARAYE